jgi:hypothetical protein
MARQKSALSSMHSFHETLLFTYNVIILNHSDHSSRLPSSPNPRGHRDNPLNEMRSCERARHFLPHFAVAAAVVNLAIILSLRCDHGTSPSTASGSMLG